MKEAVLITIIVIYWTLFLMAGIRLSNLEERITRIENWLEAVCKKIVEEIDQIGNEE